MGVKLWGFLIFCHLFAIGNLMPNMSRGLNETKYYASDHLLPPRNFIPNGDNDNSVNVQNNRNQRNNVTQTAKPTTVALLTTEKAPEAEAKTSLDTSTTAVTLRVTGPNNARYCPEGQSYLTEKDLNDMIHYFAIENNLVETINATFFDFAVQIREKHANDMIDFTEKLRNKPTHLRHILEDMVQMRNLQIDPLVKEVLAKLPEISSLQTAYNTSIHDSNVQLQQVEKIKQICLMCDATESRSRPKRSVIKYSSPPQIFSPPRKAKKYYGYCTTLTDVRTKINTELSQFKNEQILTLRNKLGVIDHDYDTDYKELKTKIKEEAVQKFGTTIYDILDLQDEYYHFLNFLKGGNGINEFESLLSNIKKTNMQIGYKIEELKADVQKYKKHCLSCASNLQRYQRDTSQMPAKEQTEPVTHVPTTKSTDNVTSEPDIEVTTSIPEPDIEVTTSVPSNDILDKLLSSYIDGIKSKFQNVQDELFRNLNFVLTDENTIKKVLANLTPIQSKIMIELKDEELKINDLKNKVPDSSLENLKKLNEDSMSLQMKLEEAIKFILVQRATQR